MQPDKAVNNEKQDLAGWENTLRGLFLGWVSDFDGKVQILAPVIVKEQYRQVIAQADKK